MKRTLLAAGLLAVVPALAAAWPAETMTALTRDARKLLPRSLSRLLGERESEVIDELQKFPPDVTRALAQDLPTGRLRAETLKAQYLSEQNLVVDLPIDVVPTPCSLNPKR